MPNAPAPGSNVAVPCPESGWSTVSLLLELAPFVMAAIVPTAFIVDGAFCGYQP